MKESKPYPRFEEEDGSCQSAKEPTVTAYSFADTCHAGPPAEIPGLPHSWEEFVECIAEGEEEFERGEFMTWETATQRIKAHLVGHGS